MTDREMALMADAMRGQVEAENDRLRRAMRQAVDILVTAAMAPAEPHEWTAEDIVRNEG